MRRERWNDTEEWGGRSPDRTRPDQTKPDQERSQLHVRGKGDTSDPTNRRGCHTRWRLCTSINLSLLFSDIVVGAPSVHQSARQPIQCCCSTSRWLDHPGVEPLNATLPDTQASRASPTRQNQHLLSPSSISPHVSRKTSPFLHRSRNDPCGPCRSRNRETLARDRDVRAIRQPPDVSSWLGVSHPQAGQSACLGWAAGAS